MRSEIYSHRLDATRVLSERIQSRHDDLVLAAAQDAGFTTRVTSAEINSAVRYLQSMEEELPRLEGGSPYGTVAAIFPYDAPTIVLARMAGNCMLAGNRLVFSLSSATPLSARIISEIVAPFDGIQALTEEDNRAFGARCAADPEVRVLFISGASSVGDAYRGMRECFDKIFFAGPGGMPACAVFQDANPETAADFIFKRAFLNSGQYCTTIKKALIHRNYYNEIRDALLHRVSQLRVGSPLDDSTDIGPIKVIRTRKLLSRVLEQMSGANILAGKIEGDWIKPFLLESDSIPDLELFGPFLVLKPFDEANEAVREIISTKYGFLLTFFGTPPEGAIDAFHENFGMVQNNPNYYFTNLRLPFGGKKGSGWIIERMGDGWKTRTGAFYYSQEMVRPQ